MVGGVESGLAVGVDLDPGAVVDLGGGWGGWWGHGAGVSPIRAGGQGAQGGKSKAAGV